MEKRSFKDRNEWRDWLSENHQSADGIWLVYYKVKAKTPSVRYAEAVEEALCFGWIDSQVKGIDDETYMQRYTPRRKGSTWSAVNKRRVDRMMEASKMTPAGLEKIERAKEDGSWEILSDIDGEMVVPDDLKEALSANPKARQNFENFSLWNKRRYLYWLKSAKRQATREKRLREIVRRTEQNIKPGD